MKVKINAEDLIQDVWAKIYDDHKEDVLRKGLVECDDISCFNPETNISCEDCIFVDVEVLPLKEVLVEFDRTNNCHIQHEKSKFMTMSSELALSGVFKGAGGPFGSVVVKDGIIVGYGHNTVVQDNDPTAHGEMNAIKDACKNLNTFDLTGCELYTSSEPCPMCLSAIMWANIKKVYYGCTVQDAEDIGFRDVFIYNWLKDRDSKVLNLEQVNREQCLKAFELWRNKQDKTQY